MCVLGQTFQLVGDRGDVELDRVLSLIGCELGAEENVLVVEAEAAESGGLDGARQREAEERGGDGAIGEVEELSSGQRHVGVRRSKVGGPEVGPIQDYQSSVGHVLLGRLRNEGERNRV